MQDNRVKRVNIINPCKKPVIKNNAVQYRAYSIPLHQNNHMMVNHSISLFTPRTEVSYHQSVSSTTKENAKTGRHSYKNTDETLLTDHSYEKNTNVQELRILFNDIFGFTNQLHRSQNRQRQIIQKYEKQRNSLDSSSQDLLLYSEIRHAKRLSQLSCQQSRPILQYSSQKRHPNTPESEQMYTQKSYAINLSSVSQSSSKSQQHQVKNLGQPDSNQLIMISQAVEYQYSDRSDQQAIPKKNIIQSLTSSYSLQQLENQDERRLFWQLLQSKNMDWLNIFPKMKIPKGEIHNFVKIGDDQKEIQENQTVSRFISMWLATMGYEDPQNKSRVLKTVSFSFQDNNIMVTKVAQKLYESLFHGFLPAELQLNALMNVCKQGWEYFSFLICKFIRILSKNKRHESQQFYKKLKQAINM